MLSQVLANSGITSLGTTGRRLFLKLGQYRGCHVRVEDMPERLAAIAVDSEFYSFFKMVSDRDKALDIVARLFDAGDDALITENPKGYAIWLLEPTAVLAQRR
jgi:hypothetical protein